MRDKAQENWGVGITCLSRNHLNAAANRLYYGVFQAVLWYAKRKKLYPETPDFDKRRKVHFEMGQLVNSEFSINGDYGKRMRHAFSEFLALRLTADYEPETPSIDEIKEIVQDGQALKDHYLKAAGA